MGKEELFTQALQLDPEDREALIRALADSLAEEEDPDMTPELAAELERRIAAAEADPSQDIPWEQARAEIEAEIRTFSERRKAGGAG